MNPAPLPSIGVITPSFRQAGYIAQMIESVREQNYSTLEHWIIDAKSDDGTAEVVAGFQSLPYLRWISEPDRGQSDAINKGARLAGTEIIGWLNADDLYFPHALRAVGEAFRDNPGVDVIYGGGVKADAAGFVLKKVPARPFDPRLLRYRFYVLQPSLFFRRRLFLEVGGLNEASHYAMDWELMLKFAERSRILAIPQVLSQLRCYPDTKTSTGGWPRLREIAEIGRKFNGPLDRNYLSFRAREFVSRIADPRAQEFGRQLVDRITDGLFGGSGLMVQGWPK